MKNLTMKFTVGMFIVIAIYDVFAMAIGGTENSISHLMITAAYHYPIFPFLMGVLVGHLFWRMRDTKATAEIAKTIVGEDKAP